MWHGGSQRPRGAGGGGERDDEGGREGVESSVTALTVSVRSNNRLNERRLTSSRDRLKESSSRVEQ